jgi:hypothetical protein
MIRTLFILIMSLEINAQIIVGDSLQPNIYYNNIQDTSIGLPWHSNYAINSVFDLNNDNIADVDIEYENIVSPAGFQWHVFVTGITLIQFLNIPAHTTWLDTASLNNTLTDFDSWTSCTSCIVRQSSYSGGGPTVNQGVIFGNNKYMGFRLINTSDTLYGWMKVDVTTLGITLKSYAVKTNNVISVVERTLAHNLVQVYPNPATQSLHISDENMVLQNTTLEVSNFLGQTLIKQAFTHTMDVSHLPAGIYTLKVNAEGKEALFAKFIKE